MNKLRNHKGASLAETLLATALLGIVLAGAVSGIGSLKTTYDRITRRSEAAVLLSTINTSINADLHSAPLTSVVLTAGDESGADGTYQVEGFYCSKRRLSMTYVSGTAGHGDGFAGQEDTSGTAGRGDGSAGQEDNSGAESGQASSSGKDGRIMIRLLIAQNTSSEDSAWIDLLPDKAYTNGLKAEISDFTFTVTNVEDSGDNGSISYLYDQDDRYYLTSGTRGYFNYTICIYTETADGERTVLEQKTFAAAPLYTGTGVTTLNVSATIHGLAE